MCGSSNCVDMPFSKDNLFASALSEWRLANNKNLE